MLIKYLSSSHDNAVAEVVLFPEPHYCKRTTPAEGLDMKLAIVEATHTVYAYPVEIIMHIQLHDETV